MENKSQEAYEKLKNMTLFSEDFTSFEAMFAELLHEGKEKEALAYVLKVTFRLLKSEGEVFNEILALTPEAKSKELSTWVRTTRGTLK